MLSVCVVQMHRRLDSKGVALVVHRQFNLLYVALHRYALTAPIFGPPNMALKAQDQKTKAKSFVPPSSHNSNLWIGSLPIRMQQ